MTRRRFLPSRRAFACAWLAFALFAVARARLEGSEAHPPSVPAAHAAEPKAKAPESAPAHAAKATDHGAHAAAPAHPGHGTPADAKAEPKSDAKAEVHAAEPAADAAAKNGKRKRTTDEISGLLSLGANLAERGDYSAAEIAYHQVLESLKVSQNDVKSALLGLARMFRRQGASTKAAAIYERYIKEYPTDERTPDALLELGRTLRDLGVYKTAIARFYSVINSTLKLPGDGFDRYQLLARTAQFEIAETYFQAGDFAEANKFFTRLRLLDLAPVDRARAHFKAGYALKLQGDLEGAINTLRAYIEQWPEDENVPEARYLIAISFRELKRPQEAFAQTLELLRTEKARIEADPKRWAYWQRRTGNQLANDFFESGDTLNARAIYAGLLAISTENTWRLPITYQLGLCDERLGHPERARVSYQAIIDAAGKTPGADVTELATMAKWRLEHIDWREKTSGQISSYFGGIPAQPEPVAPPPAPAPVPADAVKPGAVPPAARDTHTPAPSGAIKTAATP